MNSRIHRVSVNHLGRSTQVFETTDNGQTWTAIGTPLDPRVVVETIDVTKSDPNRISHVVIDEAGNRLLQRG